MMKMLVPKLQCGVQMKERCSHGVGMQMIARTPMRVHLSRRRIRSDTQSSRTEEEHTRSATTDTNLNGHAHVCASRNATLLVY